MVDQALVNISTNVNATSLIPSPMTVVGAAYITLGLLGIIENGFTAILITTDSEMRNPTYFFMINMCIADSVLLIPIALYSGLALIYPNFASLTLVKFNSYLIAVGWTACVSLLILMSFSRFVQLTRPNRASVYFTKKRLWITIALIWITPTLYNLWLLIYQGSLPHSIDTNLGTWFFNLENTAGLVLYCLDWFCGGWVVLLMTYFNSRSLIYVRRVRKQIQTTVMDTNMAREIKLFFQVVTTSTITLMCASMIGYFNHTRRDTGAAKFIFYQFVWIFHHMHSSIVYFLLNAGLRQRFLQLIRREQQVQQTTNTKSWTAGLS